MTLNANASRKRAFSVLRSATLALVGLAACGAVSAANLQVESVNGNFLAEAFPAGPGYTYSFSATPNLLLDPAQYNSITGSCLPHQGDSPNYPNYGNGTIYVTVTYPNGHIESTQKGVNCRTGGLFGF